MEENYFLVSSITYAIKGQELLQRKGYKAYVIRDRERNEHGCGYAILARAPRERAADILAAGHVKVAGVREAEKR